MSAKPIVNTRLHHNAHVTTDMAAVREFYEDVIGFPLVATWCEKTDLFGKVRTYMHCFFEIGDGECLAFFQFQDEEDQQEFGPELPLSGFRHLAMKVDQEAQDGIRDRLAAAGYEAPDTYILNHGYCQSLYVFDPAKLLIEFTVDCEDMEQINAERKADAHSELERWLAGDHSPNNEAYHR
ncbi:VOC family protein [Gammaproteobacteria bacterium]|jgi:catechol 2,3-dioxygenase-like lactoylglutathione lyase family enzyme|nr:VOC family protein [Gammaproteobacteria bacterium]